MVATDQPPNAGHRITEQNFELLRSLGPDPQWSAYFVCACGHSEGFASAISHKDASAKMCAAMHAHLNKDKP